MTDLRSWFEQRPIWVRKAATMLHESGTITETDIEVLAGLCKRETKGDIKLPSPAFPTGAFSNQPSTNLRLLSISNVQGINALAPKSPLRFGQNNLTVVYGSNGSGKSGYVRILKHACGARNPGTLHPNVYADYQTGGSCTIEYKRDGNTQEQAAWTVKDGTLADLASVDIFDAARGSKYVEEENDVKYEPPILSFFSELIAVCNKVARNLNGVLESNVSKKPILPGDFAKTTLGKWYQELSGAETSEIVAQNTTWTDDDGSTLSETERRYAESSPLERVKELRAKKQHADQLIRYTESELTALSDEKCKKIISLRVDVQHRRQAATTASEKLFSNTPLAGVGSETWRMLWEYARRYSLEHAYEELDFPNVREGARCVLCQQSLSEEAGRRLKSFEKYVKDAAVSAVKQAEKNLDQALERVNQRPEREIIEARYDASGLTHEGDLPPVLAFFDQFSQRFSKLLEAASTEDLTPLPSCGAWLERSKAISSNYEEAQRIFERDAENDPKPQLAYQRLELKTRKWLAEQLRAIQEEVERGKALDLLGKAKRNAESGGRVLSTKKGDLAIELITEGFVQRFRDQLHNLRASHIKVELVKKRVERGRVLHEIRLKGSDAGRLTEILSEGEYRIVSFAAFLADVMASQHPTPFVFDDPISSLDQDFEEAVAHCLVDLAKERQVIVFTHRISLFVSLMERCKKMKIDPQRICVRREPWGTGEPGDVPIFAQKPINALNKLLNERLSNARKIFEQEGFAGYAPVAKAICSDFRILLERMVESELMGDVVQRFRRSVQTQDRIERLALITSDDCKFFDGMMTKYSIFEHSQPIEAPVEAPPPEILEDDLTQLQVWHKKYRTRVAKE
jgi:energy-coupling factor transporter ATP-binding protein EcfA2